MNPEERKERKCFGDVRNGVKEKREDGGGGGKEEENFPPTLHLSRLGLDQ